MRRADLADTSTLSGTWDAARDTPLSKPGLFRAGLRTVLAGIVVLALLPGVAITALLTVQQMNERREAFEQALLDTARQLAERVDGEIGRLRLGLRSFSEPASGPSSTVQLEVQAQEMATALGAGIVIRDLDGHIVLARPAVPPGLAVPRQVGLVLGGAELAVTDLFATSETGDPQAAIIVPRRHTVDIAGRPVVTGTAEAMLGAKTILAMLRGALLLREVRVFVQDGGGRSLAIVPPVPTDRPAVALPPITAGAEGIGTEMPDPDQPQADRRVWAFRRPQLAPDWTVVVTAPLDHALHVWLWPQVWRLVEAVAGIGIGVVIALVMARRLAAPLAELTRQANAAAAGAPPESDMPGPPGPAPGRIREFEALRLGLCRADFWLRRRGASERRALDEARSREEMLASVINATSDVIVVKDLSLRYVLGNRAALELGDGGLQFWELNGRRAADLCDTEMARHVEQVDREVIRLGETRHTVAQSRLGGRRRIMGVAKSPLRDSYGRTAGVVTVARDITDDRVAEDRLRTVQTELLRVSRLSAMGAMASGLAHELNQPLAAATNYLNAAVRMLDRVPGPSEPADEPVMPRRLAEARAAVGDGAVQVLRAGAIVRRLRDFLCRGEAEPTLEDVSDLIAEAVAVARGDGSTALARLSVAVGSGLPRTLLDRAQMQQVLLNLIRNAAEACSGLADGRIIVAAAGLGAEGIEITVLDNGPGIAPDLFDRVFEPFVSSKANGLGIGLAICRTIVEAHGGTLRAEHADGGGALFRIGLPANAVGVP